MGAAFVGDALGPADPRAANRDAQTALGGRRLLDRGRDRRLVGHVCLDEARAELSRQRLALLGVEVGDDDTRASRRQGTRRGLAEPGSPARDQRPCSDLNFHNRR